MEIDAIFVFFLCNCPLKNREWIMYNLAYNCSVCFSYKIYKYNCFSHTDYKNINISRKETLTGNKGFFCREKYWGKISWQ